MKRFVAVILSSLAVASISQNASAQEAGGFEVGLRTGYAIAMGDSAKNSPLSDSVSGQIPIWLDAGYRINPSWYVGAYGQYGFGMVASKVKDACAATGRSCSAHDIRFGANVHYHIMPAESFDPWVGLGLGYEIMSTSSSGGGGPDGSSSAKGFEFLNVQVGGDYKVTPQLGIGPFVSFSVGQFSSASASSAGVEVSGDIPDKGIHEWLTLGVRGVYDVL
jgi:outer membrane protein W